MGEIVQVNFRNKEIEFTEGEFRLDDRGGGLVVIIPMATAERRVRESRPEKRKPDRGREPVPDLAGVNWDAFYALNVRQTKTGKRSDGKIASLKRELGGLAGEYGVWMLNGAIARLREPGHAQIPYLKAVLKNMKAAGKGRTKQDEHYGQEIEDAIAKL